MSTQLQPAAAVAWLRRGGKRAPADLRNTVALRPTTDEDVPFLLTVYASTRADELALTGWDGPQVEAFVRQQFEAQHAYYHTHYTETSFDLILTDGEPAGRLYVARWTDEIRIVDISLLPAHRGSGLGTHLLRELMQEARQTGRHVSVHVERHNSAMRLYRRLGFVQIDDQGVYVLMQWSADAARREHADEAIPPGERSHR